VADLGRPAADAAGPIEDVEDQVCRKFVSSRSQRAEGDEKVQPLETLSDVYSLHSGQYRGATWHDRKTGIIWLLAARLHRSGEPNDAYPYFKSLDSYDDLRPKQIDYELAFRLRDRSFVEAVQDGMAELLQRAEIESPAEVRGQLGPVSVGLAIERDDGVEVVTLAVSMDSWDEDGPQPPSDYFEILWAAAFPWVGTPTDEIEVVNAIGGRAGTGSELIFAAMRAE